MHKNSSYISVCSVEDQG